MITKNVLKHDEEQFLLIDFFRDVKEPSLLLFGFVQVLPNTKVQFEFFALTRNNSFVLDRL